MATQVAEWRKTICVAEGWRFYENLPADPQKATQQLHTVYSAYGVNRVYVGGRFDPIQMCVIEPRCFGGVYIRDVDELVAEIREDVLNWNSGIPLVPPGA